MEKRAFERVAVKLQARLFYGNMVYTGLVTNISEKGMFICTKMQFPVHARLITALKAGDFTYQLTIKIRRTVRPGSHPVCLEDAGLGVLLLNPPGEHIDFLTEARSSQ